MTYGMGNFVSGEQPKINLDGDMSKKIKERCRYWPNCKQTDESCAYIHPVYECKFVFVLNPAQVGFERNATIYIKYELCYEL